MLGPRTERYIPHSPPRPSAAWSELGLKVKTPAKTVAQPSRKRARDLATEAIEKISDPPAPPKSAIAAPAPAPRATDPANHVDGPKAKGKSRACSR